jgi:hemerythrin
MLEFEWNDDFSVGVRQFDNHHQHLMSLINKTSAACLNNRQAQNFEAIIGELIDYVVYHFAAEENLMKAHAYPGTGEHVNEHVQFTRRVLVFQRGLAKGSGEYTIDLVDLNCFLVNWLTHHIMEVDRKYGVYLNGLGVS